MSDPRTFGQAVREARLAKGLSMGQLAASVERSTASVRRWERDEGVPSKGTIDALAVELGLSDNDLALVGAELVESAEDPPTPRRQSVADSSQATQASGSRVTGFVAVPESARAGVKGWYLSLYDPAQPWLGYLRATLTIVVLFVLAWILVWALAELMGAVGEIWDGMWAAES